MDTICGWGGLLGKSAAMEEIFWKINLAAENDVTVIINGESGTGKDLVARAIHTGSERSSFDFFAINLAAMSRDLACSELFGHERGAFTGAAAGKPGIFESVGCGTVFLDEIGCADLTVQASILRILENRECRRVGSNQIYKSDARVIAATNKDLHRCMERGEFREDLFYRLEVFSISIPPLREHVGDIPVFVEAFISGFNKAMNKDVRTVDSVAMDYLMDYSWPGNVRELKNVVHSAMIHSHGSSLTTECLPARILGTSPRTDGLFIETGLSLKEVEKKYIQKSLVLMNGNKSKVSRMLGVSRRYLYNKLDEYGLGL